MIGFLRGKIIAKQPPRLLLDVNGVGYEVDAPMSTFYGLPDIGNEVQLYTHLSVTENSQTLYGFATIAEQQMFRQLIKVSGIGSRSGLTILSGISVNDFIYCVQNEDTATLIRLPGIGKKTAERLIIEMRDRIDITTSSTGPSGEKISVERKSSSPRQEATDALVALGYKLPEITRLMKTIADDKDLSTEEIIRLALQSSVRK
jgi:Holliday junction DNA helicase RuvA